MANELGLVFLVAYQELFQIPYVDTLLEYMKDQFMRTTLPSLVKQRGVYKSIPRFDGEFEKVMSMWQVYCDRRDEKSREIKKFEETSKG